MTVNLRLPEELNARIQKEQYDRVYDVRITSLNIHRRR
jgi:hypothetical protein